MTPYLKSAVEEFRELQFATCPTETKEPFFWKWSDHGKEILEDFLTHTLEGYRAEIRKKISGVSVWTANKTPKDPQAVIDDALSAIEEL